MSNGEQGKRHDMRVVACSRFLLQMEVPFSRDELEAAVMLLRGLAEALPLEARWQLHFDLDPLAGGADVLTSAMVLPARDDMPDRLHYFESAVEEALGMLEPFEGDAGERPLAGEREGMETFAVRALRELEATLQVSSLSRRVVEEKGAQVGRAFMPGEVQHPGYRPPHVTILSKMLHSLAFPLRITIEFHRRRFTLKDLHALHHDREMLWTLFRREGLRLVDERFLNQYRHIKHLLEDGEGICMRLFMSLPVKESILFNLHEHLGRAMLGRSFYVTHPVDDVLSDDHLGQCWASGLIEEEVLLHLLMLIGGLSRM